MLKRVSAGRADIGGLEGRVDPGDDDVNQTLFQPLLDHQDGSVLVGPGRDVDLVAL